MPLDADIYGYRERIAPSLAVSAALHVALVASFVLVPALMAPHGQDWGQNGSGGDIGDAMSAKLVSGIPLPANPQAKPQNILANESKGLSHPLPAPAAKPDEKAIAIPDREAKVKPAKQNAKVAAAVPSPARSVQTPPVASIAPPHPTPPQEVAKVDNTVPYGEGGPVAGPYTTLATGSGSGGLKLGDGGTGGFGNLYSWYAQAVARKVHDAWQSEVNPNVVSAKRVYITFNINRDGAPSKVSIEQSSGIPALDQSAVRALQRIDTFGKLPDGYRGSFVSVEFWFDYRR
jgi:periplasmic protein TonB